MNGSGSDAVREFLLERQFIDIGDYYADFGKIPSPLGSQPWRTLRETLEKTMLFYREHLGRYV